MNRRKKGNITGGGTRMKELGYKPIQVWVDREDMNTIKQAAKMDGRPMTRFMLRAALAAAQQVTKFYTRKEAF